MSDIIGAIESPFTTIAGTVAGDAEDILKGGLNDVSSILASNFLYPVLILGGGYILLTQLNKR